MKKSFRIIVWSLAGVVLVVAGVLVGIGLFGGGSAKGTIEPTVVASHGTSAPAELALKGKYVTLQYSSRYASENSELGDTAALEQYVLTANTNYAKTAAIIVAPLPQEGVAGDSGYRMRSLQPQTYTATTVTVNGQTIHIMAKGDGTERIAYLTHNNLLCSVALTTAYPSGDNLAAEMSTMLQSFRWVG